MATYDQFANSVKTYVRGYYAQKPARPLLLSELGTVINRDGLWPDDRGDRSLKELIGGLEPEIQTVRDEHSPAYVAVVTPEARPFVDRFIRGREALSFLLALPWPLRVAFCLDVNSEEPIFVRRTPPVKYAHAIPPGEEANYVPIEPQYRRPGLWVQNVKELGAQDADDLANKITAWAKAHHVDLDSFARPLSPVRESRVPERPQRQTNALERLYASQSPHLAASMVIPLDLAIKLSREP